MKQIKNDVEQGLTSTDMQEQDVNSEQLPEFDEYGTALNDI